MTERRADVVYQKIAAAMNPIILLTCGYLATTSYARINNTLDRIELKQQEYVVAISALRERVSILENQVDALRKWNDDSQVIKKK